MLYPGGPPHPSCAAGGGYSVGVGDDCGLLLLSLQLLHLHPLLPAHSDAPPDGKTKEDTSDDYRDDNHGDEPPRERILTTPTRATAGIIAARSTTVC